MIETILALGWPVWVIIIGAVGLVLGLIMDDLLSIILPDGLFPAMSVAAIAFGGTVLAVKDMMNATLADTIIYLIASAAAFVSGFIVVWIFRKFKNAVESSSSDNVLDLLGKEASVLSWNDNEDNETGFGEVLITSLSIDKVFATGPKGLKISDLVVVESATDMSNVSVKLSKN